MNMNLYGVKAPVEAVRQWFLYNDKPLLIFGQTGVGKTTVCNVIAEETQMSLCDDENPLKAIEDARHPSFFSIGRVALIEDAEHLTKATWNKIDKVMKSAPPIIFVSQTLNGVPYSIRRKCSIIEMKQPEPRHIKTMLEAEYDLEERLVDLLSSECKSWRQAHMNARWLIEPNSPRVNYQNSIHPLTTISIKQYNEQFDETTIQAHLLHSMAWNIEGLSEVSKKYVDLLKHTGDTKPPYRNK